MKITILAYQEPTDDKPDVVVDHVFEALKAGGHQPTVVTIQSNVIDLVNGLSKSKPDLVFNLVESFGDDIIGGLMGVTGVLDLLELPYTGGGPGELYLQEDKALSKKLLAYEQVLYPDFASFAPNAEFETGGRLRMPLFVKPLRMDASQGIDDRSLVRNTQELMERVLNIQKKFGDTALAEEYIEGRELYVGVLGNQELTAFPPIEMDFSGMPEGSPHIMDSKAKFDESSPQFKGTKAVLAELEPELKAKLQKVAIDAYRALRVREYGRIDMRLTDSGEIYVIEVNASCYLEKDSEFATSAKAAGIEYVDLVNRIAEMAVERRKVGKLKPKSKKKPGTKTSARANP
jgi:D-alanine-D-alanine ligase